MQMNMQDAIEGASTVSEVGALLVSEKEGCSRRVEAVAVETRVDIFVNGRYWASSAVSPLDVVDYTFGALFSMGVIRDADDLVGVDMHGGAEGISVFARTRSELAGATSSCLSREGATDEVLPGQVVLGWSGGCGRWIGSSDGYHEETKGGRLAPAEPEVWQLDPHAIWHMARTLLSKQDMHRATGATHAAVLADEAGEVVLMREDVGRHNAVEKLVGALIRQRIDPARCFAYLSSRCALELVVKCARAGIGIVATVSAPTTAVIEYAKEKGVTLCAFAREGRFTVYTHPERLALSGLRKG